MKIKIQYAMKKIVLTGLAALLAVSCNEYLNVEHLLDESLSLQDVFESKDYSDQWLANVYSHLDNENADVASKGANLQVGMPFNMISDDIYYNDRHAQDYAYSRFKNGVYVESDVQSSWASCYQAIRDATTYIYNIDICKELSAKEIIDRKAQARFLRAYYYWLLLRKYGPVPLLPDEGIDFTQDYTALAVPRSTYEECATYIGSELALAARDLDYMRDNLNLARPTRGAALAARAKVYLYAASPLFNGNTDPWAAQLVDHEGKRLVSETYDESKWARAAAAAWEVTDLGLYRLYVYPKRESDEQGPSVGYNKWMTFPYTRYPATVEPPYHPDYSDRNWNQYGRGDYGWKNIDPFESYRRLFDGHLTGPGNPELIFTRGQNQGNANENIMSMAIHAMPFSLNGWNTHGMSLKMYDAYYMNNGDEFPANSRPTGYTDTITVPVMSPNHYTNYPPLPPHVSLQHANREPRFYASVAYNGSIWEAHGRYATDASRNRELCYKQAFYYRDSEDGKRPGESQFYLPTGIGIKKYYHVSDYSGSVANKLEPAIRYAEILLIYAEALNELTTSYTIPSYDGATQITVSRDPSEMRWAMKQIRVRAGLPDFAPAIYNSADDFRKKLKRERQIELMGETHRYFDLRRWKDAPTEEADPMWGFNMNMPTAQRDLFDIPVEVTDLPSVFVDKMYLWPISHNELRKNRKLTQNPGWTYFTE
ncbi:MAG: RagB/SusD family nutrient uptake outer membrane protein [Prevotellaceae bacterium]|jgi:hypothetical protein|nr:RagB/SusD family nutrient uptake outer membrane protein [Prevotellaceae bacterium]